MHWFLGFYILVAVIPWAILITGIFIARSRMNRLSGQPIPLPPQPPSVTIVTPAKDEGEHIEQCVRALLRQKYPRFDIRIINDRSSDATGDIVERMAAETRQTADGHTLTVSHIKQLPDGWLGKCHALYEGTRDIETEWLLFVDSDVTIAPDALHRAIMIASTRGYDAVSLLPRLKGRSFWEKLMIPACASAWGVMFVMSWTNDDTRRNFAVANGQFFLIRRSAYEKVDGHRGVRNQIVEDVELMRSLKSAGFKCRLLAAPHLVATQMHATLPELKSGWGRIFSGTARYSRTPLVLGMIGTIVGGLSVYPMLAVGIYLAAAHGIYIWLAAALTHWVLMTGFLAYSYKAVRVSVFNALLTFISLPVLLWLLREGIHRCRDRKFDWRGTRVEI